MSRTITLPNGLEIPIPASVNTAPRGPGRPALPPGEKFEQRPGNWVKGTKWTHELAIDVIIANPDWSQKELSQYFNRSVHWISLVMSSDAFQAKLAERREEVLNPEVRASIEQRFKALAEHSLARLHEKLENPNASDNLILRSVELASKALGLGARPQQTNSAVQIAIVVPPKAEPGGPVFAINEGR